MVLNFKGDLHLHLNATVIDVSDFSPFDREAFIDAFILTFQPKVLGKVVYYELSLTRRATFTS